jgi:hypothetical protein
MAKKMVCLIGYREWAIAPQDALILLDIAKRAIPVTHSRDYKSKIVESDRDPFVTAFSLHEITEPEPPEPPKPEAGSQPPRPLQITEQRKITHDDLPF